MSTLFRTKSIEPAIAWQSSSGNIAVGAGYERRESTVVLNRNSAALNPFNGRIIDAANAYLRSSKATDSGFNVGVLFKPTSTWRFGASYRSDQTMKFKGTAKFGARERRPGACGSPDSNGTYSI